MFAIVDIETTGGHAASNGITEIAVILHDGQHEYGRFESLVNPGVPIPPYVSVLTGITDAMVADAPGFVQIAEKVYRLLKGKVFVAHNVNFDYAFIRHHLAYAGFQLDEQKLCTVRLSRKLIKGLPSYSLGNLCRSLQISVAQRHRAMGDAAATAELFSLLMARDQEGHIRSMLKPGSREAYLPMHLQTEQISALPERPGIYYFHDQKDKVIYIGKAVNIRKRVVSHFSNNAPTHQKQEFMRRVHRISSQTFGSPLLASVMESIEIQRLWPALNKSQKRWTFSYGIYMYEDRRGILRMGIDHARKHVTPMFTVPTLTEGHALLRKLVKDFSLCPRCCWLQKDGDSCIGVQEGYCKGVCRNDEDPKSYNERVRDAVSHMLSELPSFAMLEEGRHAGEKTLLWMDKGVFRGWAYVDAGKELPERSDLEIVITPYPRNDKVRAMLLREASRYPEKVYSVV